MSRHAHPIPGGGQLNADSFTLDGSAIVVALDDSPGSHAAARIAAAMEDRLGVAPHVVRAFELDGAPLTGQLMAMLQRAGDMMGPEVHDPQRVAIRRGLGALIGRDVDWPVHIHPGTAASAIAREAARQGAALIVMGLRHHGLFDRIVRDETTLNVIRASSCPVLGLSRTPRHPLQTVVVGMDFSSASIRAAEVALELLGTSGTLILACVTGADTALGTPDEPMPDVELEARLDAVRTDLVPPAGVRVIPLQVECAARSSVGATLILVAQEQQADLIAVGSGRQRWLDRAFVGSVSTDLARDGRMSLLVAPPRPLS